MAVCHSLARVKGELIGDPLEVKMFESTNWTLEENDANQTFDELVLAVIRPPNDPHIVDMSSYDSSKKENKIP